jgi:hypothetical protein
MLALCQPLELSYLETMVPTRVSSRWAAGLVTIPSPTASAAGAPARRGGQGRDAGLRARDLRFKRRGQPDGPAALRIAV